MSIRVLHHPLPQQQGCSGIYSALCTKLHATQPLAHDVSTLLEGEGGFVMIADCSGGSHMTLLYGFIFRSTFRASMFITVATKTNSVTRHGTE